MLENLGIGERLKGRKDLRGKKVIFVDDGSNPYRTMCFTIAGKAWGGDRDAGARSGRSAARKGR